jgi:large subunit ribosomal protein L23
MSFKYTALAKKKQVGALSMYDIIRSPVITEKATSITQYNQYTFKVASAANKFQIRQAVEVLFNVKVSGVNTLNYDGRLRRFRGVMGKTASYKKAIVTLKEGTIDVTVGGN